MRLRLYLYLFCGLLAALGIMLFCMGGVDKWVLYVTEGIIAALLVAAVMLYRYAAKPLDALAMGMDLLKEQDFSSRLARVHHREADKVVDVFNRMMTRLKEERLATQEKDYLLALLIRVSPMGIVIYDDSGRITLSNEAAAHMLGVSTTLEGMMLGLIDSPLAVAAREIPQGGAETLRLGDGKVYRVSRLSFMDKGYAHPFLLMEGLTDEVARAEREAYGRVIRMMAHEVNNTIAGVTSMLGVLGDMVADTPGMGDVAELAGVCASRCGNMSRFIREFAEVVKIPDARPVEMDLAGLVADCVVFMKSRLVGGDIEVTTALPDSPVTVEADPVLLEQAFVNIMKNAAESITGCSGHIHVAVTAMPPTVTIVDDGEPITPDVARNIFTPFFSTKATGQGLGLIFVRDVLDKHSCRYSLTTDADGLTRFFIGFPEK